MKKLIIVLAILAFLTVACGINPSAWNEDNNVVGILTRFEAKAEQASATARGDLPSVIGEMIDVRTELRVVINTTDVPEALSESVALVIDGMDEIIAGAQDFASMSGYSDMTDEEWDQHDLDASLRWNSGEAIFGKGIRAFLSIVIK